MSIKEMLLKVKPLYPFLLIIVVSSIAFALGRLSVLEARHTPVQIINGLESITTTLSVGQNSHQTGLVVQATAEAAKPIEERVISAPQNGEVIGSKSGKKYYFPWCGTVKRIKPENQVHFESISEAKVAGYTPGGGCKGLK